jgi:hypothetical protein
MKRLNPMEEPEGREEWRSRIERRDAAWRQEQFWLAHPDERTKDRAEEAKKWPGYPEERDQMEAGKTPRRTIEVTLDPREPAHRLDEVLTQTSSVLDVQTSQQSRPKALPSPPGAVGTAAPLFTLRAEAIELIGSLGAVSALYGRGLSGLLNVAQYVVGLECIPADVRKEVSQELKYRSVTSADFKAESSPHLASVGELRRVAVLKTDLRELIAAILACHHPDFATDYPATLPTRPRDKSQLWDAIYLNARVWARDDQGAYDAAYEFRQSYNESVTEEYRLWVGRNSSELKALREMIRSGNGSSRAGIRLDSLKIVIEARSIHVGMIMGLLSEFC